MDTMSSQDRSRWSKGLQQGFGVWTLLHSQDLPDFAKHASSRMNMLFTIRSTVLATIRLRYVRVHERSDQVEH